ncbi:MAG: aminopeptidase P family protein [Pseudomonadota bacterium]
MFQNFSAPDGDAAAAAARLAAIRARMAEVGVDGFMIPRADAHQGEYVPPSDERLAWATGFTGSAGMAVALAERAAIFVDGRYTLQAETQVPAAFEKRVLDAGETASWIAEAAPEGGVIGFDPWLHGRDAIAALRKRLEKNGRKLEPTSSNLIDDVWTDRPPPPAAAIRPQKDEHAGEAAMAKRARIGALIEETGADAAVLTLPDSIAWLLNIRGADIPRNPIPLVFAILRSDGRATLFVRVGQVDDALRDHLGTDVALLARDEFEAALRALAGSRILLDQTTAPLAVASTLEDAGAEIVWGRDPCVLPKAIKNEVEKQGARDAHIRDGAAMARFLAWLDREAPGGELTEIAIAKRLEEERRATNQLLDISFDTIAGAGPDGAIVHYRVNRSTDRTLSSGELMLIDSGGQYVDGTTDITRTIAVGEPPEDAARAFTLVLKGMIQVSMARFPQGTTGRDLDTLARAALWRSGMDYDHGTGHGIGSYLCVHEGPQSLSRRGHVPLEPGMMCSNEPGYYRTGAFGIRIENLIIVTEPETPDGGDRAMMGLETITLCPIDRRLIVADMLTAEERDWLNAYHARVRAEIWRLLDEPDAAWLEEACAPI